MSVLIKGMKMPKRLNLIIFENKNGTLICRNLDVLDDDWYEVIEVPTPHGRLIDADKMDSYMLPTEKQDKKSWFVHSAEYKFGVQHFNHALRLVRDNAPTVIESED